MKTLAYERLNAERLTEAIGHCDGEHVLVRQAFRWMLDGQVVNNAYESCSLASVCEDNGWKVIEQYGEHLAIVMDKREPTQ